MCGVDEVESRGGTRLQGGGRGERGGDEMVGGEKRECERGGGERV